MNDDAKLLLRYARDGSQVAFTELVRRHVDLVYSAAVRRCNGDTHKAEDAVQQVFTALARNAEKLASHPALSAWLYTATRNAVINLVLAEQGRAQREQEAVMSGMLSAEENGPDWSELRPVLDDMMDELSEPDRTAVLMRFFKKHSFAEIGAALNVSENTARMRTERSLEKLRLLLGKRGVRSSVAALGLVLGRQAVVAAPAALAVVVTATILGTPKGSVVLETTTPGVTKTVLTTIVLTIVAVLVTVGVYRVRRPQNRLSVSGGTMIAVATAPGPENPKAEENFAGQAANVSSTDLKSAVVATQLRVAKFDPKAEEILRKMAAVYAGLSSYQDRSEVMLVTPEGRKLGTVIGKTLFRRPGGFRMDWRRTGPSNDAIDGYIAYDGKQSVVWSSGSKGGAMPTLLSAFRSEQVLTYGSSYFVPRLLLGSDEKPPFPIDEMQGAVLTGEGTVDKISCYKVVGLRADGALQELLIGKDDYLLRRIKTNLLMPASNASDKPASLFAVRVEIRWGICPNATVEDAAFRKIELRQATPGK